MTCLCKKLPYWNGTNPRVLVSKTDAPEPWAKDLPIDRPKRACARCGKEFQPTGKRRMLCAECFSVANESCL